LALGGAAAGGVPVTVADVKRVAARWAGLMDGTYRATSARLRAQP
jgi:hypothetical protein